MRPLVTAVIPHFQSSEPELATLTRAVLDQTADLRCEIVIVANDPQNMDFPSLADLPRVTVLQPGLNLGYVGALEWVRRKTPADYLWVLQEDLVPMPDCLDHLIEPLRRSGESRLAVTSPIEIDAEGGVVDSVRAMAFDLDLGRGLPLSVEEIAGLRHPTGWSTERRVCFVLLSGALLSTHALQEIGGFDVGLWPLMMVDTETCLALQSQGFTIQMVHEARIQHDRRPPTSYPRFHHWKQTALKRNTARVAQRYGPMNQTRQFSPTPDLPVDLLYPLAQGMSEFASEYAEWVHSTSWRRVFWQAKTALRSIRSRVSTAVTRRKEQR